MGGQESGPTTLVAGIGASVVALIWGGEINTGIYVTFGSDGLDMGLQVTKSEVAVGFNISSDIYVGGIAGDVYDFEGKSATANISAAGYSATFVQPPLPSGFGQDNSGIPGMSATFGMGPGLPGGASATINETEAWSLRRGIINALCSLTGNC